MEAILDATHRRVQRHRSLQAEIEPLERVVRSYIQRSYAPDDKSDVLLALAALIYVQSPIDAIPDFAPGGLKDDELVVRWVVGRIADTLAAYADWEATLGEEFEEIEEFEEFEVDEAGESELGELPGTLNVQVLDVPDSSLFARADADSDRGAAPIAAGPIATTLAEAGIAIHQGQVLQVLGPPHLVKACATVRTTCLRRRRGTSARLPTSRGSWAISAWARTSPRLRRKARWSPSRWQLSRDTAVLPGAHRRATGVDRPPAQGAPARSSR